ncbi:MAG: HYR domain-containing protein, partial [Bacteroidota bacterium]
VQTAGLPSGASFPQGVTVQQFSYTDGGGNIVTCQFTVTASEGVSVQIQMVPASCTATCNGSAVIAPMSGTIGSALWSNGQTGLNATDLCAGQYQVTVTASAGCSQVFNTSIQVLDTEVPVLTCPPGVTTGVCNPVATFGIPQVMDNCPFNPASLQLIEGLPSGSVFPLGTITETYRYTDGGGNTALCSFTVTVQPVAGINFSFVNATCHDACDGVAIIETGGASFSVVWSNGATGTTVTGLCPGMYEAEITDPNGCEQTQTVVIAAPVPLEISSYILTDDVGNTGTGNIQVIVAGGTAPYLYNWKFNGQPFSSEKDIYNLYAGEYTLEVHDMNNCSLMSQIFTVNSSVSTSAPENGSALMAFPNPAESVLTLQLEGSDDEISAVLLTDMTGRLLFHQTMQASTRTYQLDLSGYPSGVILVRVQTQSGWVSTKIVKN